MKKAIIRDGKIVGITYQNNPHRVNGTVVPINVIDGDKSSSDIEVRMMISEGIVDEDGTLVERFAEVWRDEATCRAVFLSRLQEIRDRAAVAFYSNPPAGLLDEIRAFLRGEASKPDFFADATAHEMFYYFQSVSSLPKHRAEAVALYDRLVERVQTEPLDNLPGIISGAYAQFEKLRGEQLDLGDRMHLSGVNWVWKHNPDEGSSRLRMLSALFRLEAGVPDEVPFTGTLGTALRIARRDLPTLLGVENPLDALDVISYAVRGFWLPVDRTGLLPSTLVMEPFPIPAQQSTTKTITEVFDERAVELLAENKMLTVFWSGGIDSTAALVALLKNAAPSDLSRIRVAYRARAIGEYPLFYQNHIDGKLTNIEIPDPLHQSDKFLTLVGRPALIFSSDIGPRIAQAAQDSLIVTGEIGDQIFGSQVFGEDASKISLTSAEYLASDPSFVPFMDEINAFNAQCPNDTTSAVEMLWWWNFAVKYQEIIYRSLTDLSDPAGLANVRHFYNTDEWQRWAISNPDKRIKQTIETYKWPAKDYIFDFTGDAVYRDSKLKVGSLWVRVGPTLAFDNLNNIIRTGRTSTSPARLTAKYGNTLQRFVK